MQAAICLLAVVPVRKEPAHRSEMVTQLIFGEYAWMGEEVQEFTAITCKHDGYKGWVQTKQLVPVQPGDVMETTSYTAAFATPVTVGDAMLFVPATTPVLGNAQMPFTVHGKGITYLQQPQSTWQSGTMPLNATTLAAISQPFLHAPYLWGGRSVFGIDCSGLVQQVFKIFGKPLQRDAYLQATEGEAVNSLADARLGDLAFFSNEAGKITHVGILLDDQQIIHAAGQVRIDEITTTGIINRDTRKQSHVLHSIRRVI